MKIHQNKIVKCEQGIKIVKHDGSKTHAEMEWSILTNGTRGRSGEPTQPARSNALCRMDVQRGRAVSVASSGVGTREPGSIQRDNQARVDVLPQPQIEVMSANAYRKAIAI